jgi:thiol-disulfide isomerase/thioredoxin
MRYLFHSIIVLFLLLITIKSEAQEIHPFNLVLDTFHLMFDDAPILNLFNPLSNRPFESTVYPARKNVYPLTISVNLSKPVFFEVINTPLLAIPRKTVRGCISDGGFKLIVYNGSDVNNFLLGVNDTAQKFHATRWRKKTTLTEYSRYVDSFSMFINRRIAYINSAEATSCYQLNNQTSDACIEYCQMMLADYIVFPIHNNEADKQQYVENEIDKKVKIKNPDYWIYTRAGRNFLTTYFFDVLLARHKNNLDEILTTESLCRHNPIRRYLGYQYFSSLLKNDSSFTDYMWAVKSIDDFKKKYDCSREDIKMFDKLREQFLRKGNDVTELFKKQLLADYAGKEVKEDLLKEKGKIFVYYWASWCIPCIETISKIKNTTVTYQGQQYKAIFISIDKKREQWLKAKREALTAGNSFRLTNLVKKSFFTVFQVSAVPRIFYIDNGKLMETNYPKEKFETIFNR